MKYFFVLGMKETTKASGKRCILSLLFTFPGHRPLFVVLLDDVCVCVCVLFVCEISL